MSDFKEFIRALEGKPGRASLFEPFPSKKIVSQMIWRAGEHLWNTTEHCVSTLISLYSYIKSDVAIVEAGSDNIEAILSCEYLLPDYMRFVVISNDKAVLKLAEESDSVCALATYTELCGNYSKPLIYIQKCVDNINRTKIVDSAAARGCAGIYVRAEAEQYVDAAKGRIAVLGGLGIDYINSAEPLEIYARVRSLFSSGKWLVGTGGFGETADYLGFISMLGIYNHLI